MALSFKTDMTLQRLQNIILMLKESPKTAKQIRDKLELHEDVCRDLKRYLIKEKQVYICDYVVEKHTWSRVYALGDQPSVDKSKYVGSLQREQIRKRAERDKIRFAKMTELGLRRVKERKPRAPKKERVYVVKRTKKKEEKSNFSDLLNAWYGERNA